MSNVQLDQKRLSEYTKGFKIPIQNLMADVNQIVPNTIDQLIKQCVLLEMELKKVTDQRDKLLLEKTTVKTPKIVKPCPDRVNESNNPTPKIVTTKK